MCVPKRKGFSLVPFLIVCGGFLEKAVVQIHGLYIHKQRDKVPGSAKCLSR